MATLKEQVAALLGVAVEDIPDELIEWWQGLPAERKQRIKARLESYSAMPHHVGQIRARLVLALHDFQDQMQQAYEEAQGE